MAAMLNTPNGLFPNMSAQLSFRAPSRFEFRSTVLRRRVMKLIERCDAVLLPEAKPTLILRSLMLSDTLRPKLPIRNATRLMNCFCKTLTTCASPCSASVMACRY